MSASVASNVSFGKGYGYCPSRRETSRNRSLKMREPESELEPESDRSDAAGAAGVGPSIADAVEGFGGFIPFDGLARASGAPPVSCILRYAPGDFVVEEELGFEPEGTGPHHWLLVRKTSSTTPFAARVLAGRFDVPVRDVGFAGLKDRHAITTQWFTVPAHTRALGPEPGHVADGVRIVRAARGRKKLRRGVHTGNRFAIALREMLGDREAFAARVRLVARTGVPNYFGAQRFGREGGNVAAAGRLLRGEVKAPDRLARGLYLSTARSLLFNRVLHRRVEAGAWNACVPGDAIVIAGRSRALAPGAAPREGGTAREWVAALRAHPTGPLWGRGSSAGVAADALAFEWAALGGCEGWQAGLEGAGLEASRRALRVVPADLEWEAAAGDNLVVRFALPRGAYATAVVRELARERPIA